MTSPDSIHSLNRTAYDRIAPRFAEVNKEMPSNLAASASRLIDRSASLPGPILDLGCGAGRDLAWFDLHDAPAIGADLSQGMLAQARQATIRPVYQMDMLSLGFASGCFRAIWCCAALLHLPKSEAPLALAEMARVLIPGGALSLSIQKGSGEGTECDPYTGAAERFFARYEPDEMTDLLVKAGFLVLAQGENIFKRHWLWFDAQKEGNHV
jgi:ubiquinone/menaquinone biosynthesis C-methylase UbiE